MQQTTSSQLSDKMPTSEESFSQPQVTHAPQSQKAQLPQAQHEAASPHQALEQPTDKKQLKSHRIPRLRAVVESQAFKNILVDEMDMMMSRAATLIQANWRGYQLRKKLISQMMAAKAIQDAWQRFSHKGLFHKHAKKVVEEEEKDIPFHRPQQVRFLSQPLEGQPSFQKSLSQPVMVDKETQFPLSNNLPPSALQDSAFVFRSPSITFLTPHTAPIGFPCPMHVDPKYQYPCVLTKTIKSSCLFHIEEDIAKGHHVTPSPSQVGAVELAVSRKCVQEGHGPHNTHPHVHVEAEAPRLPYSVPTVTRNPPRTSSQTCSMTMATKTPPQTRPAAADTKTPPQTSPRGIMTKTQHSSCYGCSAAAMAKSPSHTCSMTKNPLQARLVTTVTKSPTQMRSVTTLLKTLCLPPTNKGNLKVPSHTGEASEGLNDSTPIHGNAAKGKANFTKKSAGTALKPSLHVCVASEKARGSSQETRVSQPPAKAHWEAEKSKVCSQKQMKTEGLSKTNLGTRTSRTLAWAKRVEDHSKPETQAQGKKETQRVHAAGGSSVDRAVASRPTQPAATLPKTHGQAHHHITQGETLSKTISRTLSQSQLVSGLTRGQCQTCASAQRETKQASTRIKIPVRLATCQVQAQQTSKRTNTQAVHQMPPRLIKTQSPIQMATGPTQVQVQRPCRCTQKVPELIRSQIQAQKPPGMAKSQSQTPLVTAKTSVSPAKTESQAQHVAELTRVHVQRGTPCELSRMQSQARLRTELTEAQLLPAGSSKTESQTQKTTSPTKALSQSRLTTEMATSRHLTNQPADLSKSQSQSQSQPDDKLTQAPGPSLTPGNALQGSSCPPCLDIQGMLEPLLAGESSSCSTESWGNGEAARASVSANSQTTLSSEEASTCQLMALCAELTAALSSQEDLHSLLCKALSQSEVRAALSQVLSKEVLGTTLAKAMPHGILQASLVKALSWSELGTAASHALSRTELRTELARVLQVRLADVLSKTLTEDEQVALSQALCQGELGAVLSTSLSQVALRTAALFPQGVVKMAGSSPAAGPGMVEVDCRGTPSDTWRPTLGLSRMDPNKVRVLHRGAWEEMGDGAALGRSPCLLDISMGDSLTVHQCLLGLGLNLQVAWGAGAGLCLRPKVDGGKVSAFSSTGPDLPQPSHLWPSRNLWPPLLTTGIGTSASRPSVAGDTTPNSHIPREASRVAPCAWSSLESARGASGRTLNPVGDRRDTWFHQPSVICNKSSCWCQFSEVSREAPRMYHLSTAGQVAPGSQPPDHKQTSMSPRDLPGKGISSSLPACYMSREAHADALEARGLSPGLVAPEMQSHLVAQVNTQLFQPPFGLAQTPIPVQKSPQAWPHISPTSQPQELKTGSQMPMFNRLMATSKGVRLTRSISEASEVHGMGCSNSQGSLQCCSSASLFTTSMASSNAIDLVEEPSDSNLDSDPQMHPLLPGMATGKLQRPREKEEANWTQPRYTYSSLCQPTMALGLGHSLYHGLVASPMSFSIYQGSESDVPSDLGSTDKSKSLQKASGSVGLVRSLSLESVTHILHQQARQVEDSVGKNRMASSLSYPSVAGGLAPSSSHLPTANREAPTLFHSSVSRRVAPNLTHPSVAKRVAPSLAQSSAASGVTPSLAQPSEVSRVVFSPYHPSAATGVISSPAQRSEASRVAPSLTQPPAVGGAVNPFHASAASQVALNLLQPFATSRVAPNLTRPSVPNRTLRLSHPSTDSRVPPKLCHPSSASEVAPNLAQLSVTRRVTFSPSPSSVIRKVTPSLAQLSVANRYPSLSHHSRDSGVAPSLTQASTASRRTPSLYHPFKTSRKSRDLVHPTSASRVAPRLDQPTATSGVAASLAQQATDSGVNPSLVQPCAASGVNPSLSQPTTASKASSFSYPWEASRVAPSPNQPSTVSKMTTSFYHFSVDSAVAPSLYHPSAANRVTPPLTHPSVTSKIAPGLPHPFETNEVALSVAQPSVASRDPSLSHPSLASEVTPDLVHPSVVNKMPPSLSHPSADSWMSLSYSQLSVVNKVPTSLVQSSEVHTMTPSLASVAKRVAPSVSQPSMASKKGPSLARPSAASVVAPSLASVPRRVAPGVSQPPGPGSRSHGADQANVASRIDLSMVKAVAPCLPDTSTVLGATPSAGTVSCVQNQSSPGTWAAPSHDTLVDSRVTSRPWNLNFSVEHQSVSQAAPVTVSTTNLHQASVASGRVTDPGHGVSIFQENLHRGMAPSMSQGNVAADIAPNTSKGSVTTDTAPSISQGIVAPGMIPSISQGTVAAGMAPSMSWRKVTASIAPDMSQGTMASGVAPNKTQGTTVDGMGPRKSWRRKAGMDPGQSHAPGGLAPVASWVSEANVPSAPKQTSRDPGFSQPSLSHRLHKDSLPRGDPRMSHRSVHLQAAFDYQQSVAIVASLSNQQANGLQQGSIMDTASDQVSDSVVRRLTTTTALGSVTSGSSRCFVPGSVIWGMDQNTSSESMISDMSQIRPTSSVISKTEQAFPPGSTIGSIAQILPPGYVPSDVAQTSPLGYAVSGMAQTSPPGSVASDVDQTFSSGSVASDMAQTLLPGLVASNVTPTSLLESEVSHEAHTFLPGSTIRGTAQTLPPVSVASGVAQVLAPGSVASNVEHTPPPGPVGSGLAQAPPPGTVCVVGGVAQTLALSSVAFDVEQTLSPGSSASGVAQMFPPGSTISDISQTFLPCSVAGGVAHTFSPVSTITDMVQTLPRGSVISGMAQTPAPESMVSGVAQISPPGYVAIDMAQTSPPESVASGVAQTPPPESVASGVAQTLPPQSMATTFTRTLPSDSGASGVTLSSVTAAVSGGKRQNVSVGPPVSRSAPGLCPSSVTSRMTLNVPPGSMAAGEASGVPPASVGGELSQNLVAGPMANVTKVPVGSLLIRITPCPYYDPVTGEGSLAPFPAASTAQLHLQILEANGIAGRPHQTPTVPPRASQMDQDVGMMPSEATENQAMLNPEHLGEEVWSRVLESFQGSNDFNSNSLILEGTLWMCQGSMESDKANDGKHLPEEGAAKVPQMPLLDGAAASHAESTASGEAEARAFLPGSVVSSVALTPSQASSLAKQSLAGSTPRTLQPRSAARSNTARRGRSPDRRHVVNRVTSQAQRTSGVPPDLPAVPQSLSQATTSTATSTAPQLPHDSSVAPSLPQVSTAPGSPGLPHWPGGSSMAPHVHQPPSLASRTGSTQFQMDPKPGTPLSPLAEEVAQGPRLEPTRKSFRSVQSSIISQMLKCSLVNLVPPHQVQEKPTQLTQGGSRCTAGSPHPGIFRSSDQAQGAAMPRIRWGTQRVSLGYESSPGSSRQPLFLQESLPEDFHSPPVPPNSRSPSLNCKVLQGLRDAGVADGQPWNATVPGIVAGPRDSTEGPRSALQPARDMEPWVPAAVPPVDSRKSGQLLVSAQTVEQLFIQAVTVIQAHARGYLVRRIIKIWHYKATIIQVAWRSYTLRKQLHMAAQTLQLQDQQMLQQDAWATLEDSDRPPSEHRCFQCCQLLSCALCQRLSPQLGNSPSVVLLVGSSSRTCHMCGQSMLTRVVQGTGQGTGRGTKSQEDATLSQSAHDAQVPPDCPQLPHHHRDKAATAIQSAWRGFWTRRVLRQQQVAARRVQASWRGHFTRSCLTTDALLESGTPSDHRRHKKGPTV